MLTPHHEPLSKDRYTSTLHLYLWVALQSYPGRLGQTILPSSRAMRPAGSFDPSPSLLRTYAVQLTSDKSGSTAHLDPSGSRSGSCSRAEAAAPIVQVTGDVALALETGELVRSQYRGHQCLCYFRFRKPVGFVVVSQFTMTKDKLNREAQAGRQ